MGEPLWASCWRSLRLAAQRNRDRAGNRQAANYVCMEAGLTFLGSGGLKANRSRQLPQTGNTGTEAIPPTDLRTAVNCKGEERGAETAPAPGVNPCGESCHGETPETADSACPTRGHRPKAQEADGILLPVDPVGGTASRQSYNESYR